MSKYHFEFYLPKSAYLRKSRGIGFEEIITLIEAGKLLDSLPHPKRDKYPQQEIFILDIGGYVWIVPYIRKGDAVRLITCYPSRKDNKEMVFVRKGEFYA